MTLTNNPSTDKNHTLQQHHQQAGDHLQHAATSHLAAAKLHGAGDHKGADQHAQTASDHTAKASQHVAQASKVTSPTGHTPTAQVK